MAKHRVIEEVPGEKRLYFPLFEPGMKLDLTADPWNLPDPYVQIVDGVDVIHAGRLRPDGGRKAFFTDPPVALQAITTVWACNVKSLAPVIIRGSKGLAASPPDWTPSRYDFDTVSITNLVDNWPADIVGALVIKNSDARAAATEFSRIDSLTGGTIANLVPAFTAVDESEKFTIIYERDVDRRGLLISDGRRFYVVRGTTWTLWHDLGSDDYLGLRWQVAQIAPGRIMLVEPTQIPRCLQLVPYPYKWDGVAEEDSAYYAGMITPSEPSRQGLYVDRTTRNYGLAMGLLGTADYRKLLSNSYNTKVKVRAVNLETGAESQFVDAFNNLHDAIESEPPDSVAINYVFDGGETTSTTVIESDYFVNYSWLDGDVLVIYGPAAEAGTYPLISKPATNQVETSGAWTSGVVGVYGEILTTNSGRVRAILGLEMAIESLMIPVDAKMTHLEIWRSDAAGANYYLENRVEIIEDKVDTWHLGSAPSNRGVLGLLTHKPQEVIYTRTVSAQDTQLLGMTQMTAADVLAGRLPPVCKKAINVLGITVCLGASSSESVVAQVDAKSFYMYDATYSATTKRVTREATYTNSFTDYVWQDGDRWEFVNCIEGTERLTTYAIASKIDADSIELVSAGAPAGNLTGVKGFIRRGVNVEWPRIASDELVYHSRTDKFAPESFVATPVRLSSVGDEFKTAVVAGNFGIAFMSSGVHLLIPTADRIQIETVGFGIGTPWPDSVVVFENTAFWAGQRGPLAISVSAEADDTGRHWSIAEVGGERMRKWFEDARAAGDDIDAGIDAANRCIRWRRKPVDGSVGEALQVCMSAGMWTVIHGDSGNRYVSSRFAELTDSAEERLYSVSGKNLFEENYYRSADRYPSLLSKAELSAADGIALTEPTPGTHRITRSGSAASFSPAMAGDVIHFRAPGEDRDRLSRVITAATANYVEFAAVDELAEPDRFIIGAVRMRIRSGSLGSDIDDTVKVIHGFRLDALPGAMEEYEPIAVRSYTGFEAPVVSETEIAVFNDSDPVMQTKDRCSSVEAVGSDIQIEIEHLDNASDLRMRRANAIVIEEGNLEADAT